MILVTADTGDVKINWSLTAQKYFDFTTKKRFYSLALGHLVKSQSMLIKSRLLSAIPEIKLVLTAPWWIILNHYCCHSRTRLFLCLTPPSWSQTPQGQGERGHHRQARDHGDPGGRTDPGYNIRLVTHNLATLGDAPVPLLAVDTAEDGGGGRGEDVTEAAAELGHRVLELSGQPHRTISRGRGSLQWGNSLNIPLCLVIRLEIWPRPIPTQPPLNDEDHYWLLVLYRDLLGILLIEHVINDPRHN